jgi:hypothetical protein
MAGIKKKGKKKKNSLIENPSSVRPWQNFGLLRTGSTHSLVGKFVLKGSPERVSERPGSRSGASHEVIPFKSIKS